MVLGQNGSVLRHGATLDVLEGDPSLAAEVTHEAEALELDEHEDEIMKPVTEGKEGQLVVAEEIAVGRVSWQAGEYYPVCGSFPALC